MTHLKAYDTSYEHANPQSIYIHILFIQTTSIKSHDHQRDTRITLHETQILLGSLFGFMSFIYLLCFANQAEWIYKLLFILKIEFLFSLRY